MSEQRNRPENFFISIDGSGSAHYHPGTDLSRPTLFQSAIDAAAAQVIKIRNGFQKHAQVLVWADDEYSTPGFDSYMADGMIKSIAKTLSDNLARSAGNATLGAAFADLDRALVKKSKGKTSHAIVITDGELSYSEVEKNSLNTMLNNNPALQVTLIVARNSESYEGKFSSTPLPEKSLKKMTEQTCDPSRISITVCELEDIAATLNAVIRGEQPAPAAAPTPAPAANDDVKQQVRQLRDVFNQMKVTLEALEKQVGTDKDPPEPTILAIDTWKPGPPK